VGVAVSTLAGHRVTDARVTLPKWGAWYADVTIDGDVTLTGAATLVMADLTLKGAVLAGGATLGRSMYRLVGGFGGWSRTLPAKAYDNDAGVKLATVLSDAAIEAGEQLDLTTLDRTARIGGSYVRAEGPASRSLELLIPGGWYVGEDGITRAGSRATAALAVDAPRVSPADLARGKIVLAPESIATILPGVIVDGITAIDVTHEVSGKGGLRSTIWGSQANAPLDSLRSLIKQLDPDRAFRGLKEYRVVTQEGERLNLQPIRVSTGLPDLRRVRVMPGIPGASATHKLGARVLVAFVDDDPAEPRVVGFEDAEGEGASPLAVSIDADTFVKLADGSRPMSATGDLAGGIWPIAGTTRVLG
jgi:hypothetical protein